MKFEGEFLFGKKWNGKGYDPKGNKVYELKNGKGFVKEYEFGQLIYEGEYLNGERNGKGKEYRKGELTFEGEYLKSKRWNGKGKEYFVLDELIYEGEYLNGKKWNGKGKESVLGYPVFNGVYSNGKLTSNQSGYLNF